MYKRYEVALNGFRNIEIYQINLYENVVSEFSNIRSNEFFLIIFLLITLIRILIKGQPIKNFDKKEFAICENHLHRKMANFPFL